MKVLLIPNSYPYSGEPFLKTEMGCLPEGVQVDVWPFFVDRQITDDKAVPSTVKAHKYAAASSGEKNQVFG